MKSTSGRMSISRCRWSNRAQLTFEIQISPMLVGQDVSPTNGIDWKDGNIWRRKVKSLDFEDKVIHSPCRSEQADSLLAGVECCVCSAVSNTVLHFMAFFYYSSIVKLGNMIFPRHVREWEGGFVWSVGPTNQLVIESNKGTVPTVRNKQLARSCVH